MFSNLNPIHSLILWAIVAVPFVIGVIWLLPRFLDSNCVTKMLVGSIIVSIITALIIKFVEGSSIQIQNIKFIAIFTALVWGILGFLFGAYFDVHLRVELGAKYYHKFLRRSRGIEYGVVGVVVSFPLGIIVGWLALVFGDSSLGLIMRVGVGAVYGGFLGKLIDWRFSS